MFNLLTHGATFLQYVAYLFSVLIIIFLVLPFHEWAHAFVASKLGDTSIKYRGRLSLNPMSHIDYMGAIFMLLFGFGWAKPVPVDDRKFKNPKVGMAITALAGPLANIVAAIVGGLLYGGIYTLVANYNQSFMFSDVFIFITFIFFNYVSINCTLAVFNLIPWPPLDGSKILFAFLPDRLIYKFYQYQQVFFIALFVLMFTGVLSRPISYLTNMLFSVVPFGDTLIGCYSFFVLS